jgi:hypothetical protein
MLPHVRTMFECRRIEGNTEILILYVERHKQIKPGRLRLLPCVCIMQDLRSTRHIRLARNPSRSGFPRSAPLLALYYGT